MQIGQHAGHGGGADVDGCAEHGRGIIGGGDAHQAENIATKQAAAAHGEVVLAQRAGQMDHYAVGDDDFRNIVQRCQKRARQALVIRHGVAQVRHIHGDDLGNKIVGEADARSADAFLGAGEDGDLGIGFQIGRLHAGFVGRGNVGHLDLHIAGHAAVASQPPARRIVLIGDMAGLRRFQISGNQPYAAFAAAAVAGAGCVDGDVRLARHLQQIFIFGSVYGFVIAAVAVKANLKHK